MNYTYKQLEDLYIKCHYVVEMLDDFIQIMRKFSFGRFQYSHYKEYCSKYEDDMIIEVPGIGEVTFPGFYKVISEKEIYPEEFTLLGNNSVHKAFMKYLNYVTDCMVVNYHKVEDYVIKYSIDYKTDPAKDEICYQIYIAMEESLELLDKYKLHCGRTPLIAFCEDKAKDIFRIYSFMGEKFYTRTGAEIIQMYEDNEYDLYEVSEDELRNMKWDTR